MPLWLEAAFWGWLAGSSLLAGAFIGFHFNLSQKLIAQIMAYGSGVLISALSFELMDEAASEGGLLSTSLGFLAGALIYTFLTIKLNQRGAKNRKRSGELQISEKESEGSGMAIALGAILDGIPESIVVGLSLLSGKGVNLVTVLAIFISNVPEGLSSASGMKNAGRSRKYVFTLWFSITLISGFASYCGFAFFGELSKGAVALTTGISAGAILSMIVDTMIPEAHEKQHEYTGILSVIGFLSAFITSKFGG